MTDTAFSQARVLFGDALLALQQGQPEAAERHLLACLQLMPGRVSPLVALGAARLRLNRVPEALAQDPTRSDAWGHRADALLRLARPAEALQALDHAGAAEAATTWHRAQALNALGRRAEALPLLDTLLAQDDSHAATYKSRAAAGLQPDGAHRRPRGKFIGPGADGVYHAARVHRSGAGVQQPARAARCSRVVLQAVHLGIATQLCTRSAWRCSGVQHHRFKW